MLLVLGEEEEGVDCLLITHTHTTHENEAAWQKKTVDACESHCIPNKSILGKLYVDNDLRIAKMASIMALEGA